MAKRFALPFATSGDKTVTPDAAAPDGSVSYSSGWGVDYQKRDDEVGYKPVGRQEMNGLFNDITGAIGEIQSLGFPEWVPVVGLVTPYPINAVMRRNGVNWRNTTANNAADPASEGSGWVDIVPGSASETAAGVVQFATSVQVTDGIRADRAVSPSTLKVAIAQLFKVVQSVTGSRVINTAYTNNTGRPIFVNIGAVSTGNNQTIAATVSGVEFIGSSYPSVGQSLGISFVVPAGAVYRLSPGQYTIASWVEVG